MGVPICQRLTAASVGASPRAAEVRHVPVATLITKNTRKTNERTPPSTWNTCAIGMVSSQLPHAKLPLHAVQKEVDIKDGMDFVFALSDLRSSPPAVLSVAIFWILSREFSSFYCNPLGKAITIGSWLPRRDFNANMTTDFVNSFELLAISR